MATNAQESETEVHAPDSRDGDLMKQNVFGWVEEEATSLGKPFVLRLNFSNVLLSFQPQREEEVKCCEGISSMLRRAVVGRRKSSEEPHTG